MVLNTGPMDWESGVLMTGPKERYIQYWCQGKCLACFKYICTSFRINISHLKLEFPIFKDRTQCFFVFFNIAIFAISFSNAKWVRASLESLMIELYLYMKIYLSYFPGRMKYVELGKSMPLTF